MRLPQRSMLQRNRTSARSMYRHCRNEVLDVPMGVLLPAVLRIRMVRKQNARIHDRRPHAAELLPLGDVLALPRKLHRPVDQRALVELFGGILVALCGGGSLQH
jgi:hypothetical protein